VSKPHRREEEAPTGIEKTAGSAKPKREEI
jgi:hypothetical protein